MVVCVVHTGRPCPRQRFYQAARHECRPSVGRHRERHEPEASGPIRKRGRKAGDFTPSVGEGKELLLELSQVYDFDWYIYGSTLRVQYDQAYINYSYRPKNIQPSALLVELKSTFVTSTTVKMASVERGHSVLFSGPGNLSMTRSVMRLW